MNRDPQKKKAILAGQLGTDPENVAAQVQPPLRDPHLKGPLRIRVLHQGKVINELTLSGTPIMLGRDPKNELPLEHEKVSRRHATIKPGRPGEYVIADGGSRNGTKVNGTVIRQETALGAGDIVEIGPFVLEVANQANSESKVEEVEGTTDTLSTLNMPGHLTAEHIAVLANLGNHLITMASADARRITLCRQMVAKDFRGLTAAILRLERGKKVPKPVLLCPSESHASWQDKPLYFSRSVARALLANPQPILATNVSNNPGAMELSLNVNTLPIAVVACPLHIEAKHIDVLYVVLPPECASLEWLALGALAAQYYVQTEAAWQLRAISEVQAAVASELVQAQRLQLRLLPMPVTVAGVDCAWGFQSCRAVGGDYVDVISHADGRLLLVIADVCGKGMPAALMAFTIYTLVHSAVRQGFTLEQMGAELNTHLHETLPDGRFVTLLAVSLNPCTGELEFLNAGHPPALAMDASGKLRECCAESNLPLGISSERPLVGKDQLSPGELMLLYTDGLTELAVDETKLLGVEGLSKILHKIHEVQRGEGMAFLADRLTQALNRIQSEQHQTDDRTFLCMQRQA